MAETLKDVMKASYDYEGTADDEMSIKEDQILYLINHIDDDWSKVQSHTPIENMGEVEPAVGLVPAAYIEPAQPLYRAVAVYDYAPQGDGEITMTENDKMTVYIKEDEWLLVKLDDKGDVGYVPANYVEEGEGQPEVDEAEDVPAAAPPMRSVSPKVDPVVIPPSSNKLKDDPVQTWSVSEVDKKGKKKKGTLGVGNGSIFFASESDKAPVQQWPSSNISSVKIDDDKHKVVDLEISSPSTGEASMQFHAGSKDHAEEIVAKILSSKRVALGGAETATSPVRTNGAASPPSPVVIRSPVPSNGPRFLPPPSQPRASPSPSPTGKSKGVRWDTAPPEEIAPVHPRLESYEEPEPERAVASPEGEGHSALALYDFEADGEDELTVKEGEKLVVIDKEGSEEWWKCRNARGEEGVVPASYIELEAGDDDGADDTAAAEAAAAAARKEQEQAAAAAAKAKRLADDRKREREAKEAREAQEARDRAMAEDEEAREREEAMARQREKDARDKRRREHEEERRAARQAQPEEQRSGANGRTPPPSTKNAHGRVQSKDLPGRPPSDKPKPTNTRTWRDRTGQFKVEAQFLGLNNGKIRLHKINGVIIEVPEEKMSAEDLDYIRKANSDRSRKERPPTARDEDNVPLGELGGRRPGSGAGQRAVPPRRPKIDWFDFFLSAGCDIDDCTRYAASFERDKMDESILPDIRSDTLRALGLREGDIIRVLKKVEERPDLKPEPPRSLDPKAQEQIRKDAELAARLQEKEYGGRSDPDRNTSPSPLFTSGPSGTLKNNTRIGRPTPSKSATLNVDKSSIATAAEQLSRTNTPSGATTLNSSKETPLIGSGFEDDAWTPRPSSTAPKSSSPAPIAVIKATPAPVSVPTPPPPPPAPQASISQAAAGGQIQRPATTSAPSSSLPSEFDNLAKLGSMRPPSVPLSTATPPAHSSLPVGFHQNMGMGNPNLPMGSFVGTQPTGSPSPLQARGGPIGPVAPVPSNEGLLRPLIPTNTGFNSFVSTRPSPLGNQGFLQAQQTGINPSFNPQPNGLSINVQPTGGFNPQPSPLYQTPQSTLSSGFSTVSSLNPSSNFTSPSNFATPSPLFSQTTGFNGMSYGGQYGGNPNPGNNFVSSLQNQSASPFNPPSTNPPPENHNPANIFASMKAGAFANDAAPQSSDRYDALRPQPTGWNGLQGLGPQPPGFQPQPTGQGFQSPIPGMGTGFNAFGQPVQQGYSQPQGYPTGYGYQS